MPSPSVPCDAIAPHVVRRDHDERRGGLRHSRRDAGAGVPLFGLRVSLSENFGIAAVFTVISLVRSFALRRLFNAMGASRFAGT